MYMYCSNCSIYTNLCCMLLYVEYTSSYFQVSTLYLLRGFWPMERRDFLNSFIICFVKAKNEPNIYTWLFQIYVKCLSFCRCFWWKGTNVTHLEDPGIYLYFCLWMVIATCFCNQKLQTQNRWVVLCIILQCVIPMMRQFEFPRKRVRIFKGRSHDPTIRTWHIHFHLGVRFKFLCGSAVSKAIIA